MLYVCGPVCYLSSDHHRTEEERRIAAVKVVLMIYSAVGEVMITALTSKTIITASLSPPPPSASHPLHPRKRANDSHYENSSCVSLNLWPQVAAGKVAATPKVPPRRIRRVPYNECRKYDDVRYDTSLTRTARFYVPTITWRTNFNNNFVGHFVPLRRHLHPPLTGMAWLLILW